MFAGLATFVRPPVVYSVASAAGSWHTAGGVLTCNTLGQAIARSGGEASTKGKDRPDSRLGNKRADCAEAVLEMVDLMGKLHW